MSVHISHMHRNRTTVAEIKETSKQIIKRTTNTYLLTYLLYTDHTETLPSLDISLHRESAEPKRSARISTVYNGLGHSNLPNDLCVDVD